MRSALIATRQVQQFVDLGDVPARTSPPALIAGVHTFLGTWAMASRTLALVAYPIEYSRVRTRLPPGR